MSKSAGSYLLLVLVVLSVSGCFGHRHKKYTFEQKFDYHTGKVMKSIKRVVSDEGKLQRIEKRILAHKTELKGFAESVRNEKKDLLNLLLKAEDKEAVKGKLKEIVTKKVESFNLLVDVLFEVKIELSEEEWTQIADSFRSECAHWWK